MFVDAHNHMDFYKDNLSNAIDSINYSNIKTLGCSMDLESYIFTKKLSKDNKNITPCFGIHPWEAHKNYKDLDKFDDYVKECKIVGEIGLDYYWVLEKEKYPYMNLVFEYFLGKAKKYDKITNIHTKGAEKEVLDYIRKYDLRTPIIHWYSGDLNILKKLLEYGCYFTISVDIGYSKLTDEIVKILPLGRILTETDGPNSLEWVNKKYGYPSEVINIVRKISLIKNLQFEEVREKIYDNFNKLKL
ncbi:TatD family hydrolase [Clostridium sp. 001]|uniref:TatD family hydrolase n=1 Tax=Clostridium sp. 001 TaxID=1970093 RepID=UPI001C2C03B4|nr:TatD family hydrolase [Clostridium sp. 001]QXE20161.1 phosphoesterase [Clostridium sp. 001]